MPHALSPPGGFLERNSTLVRLLFALAAMGGALWISEKIFLGEYLTTDENSYMFQAWLFLQGKLRLACPPIEEAFFHRMIICDDQLGWLSRYPPAHSIWLMPGVALGFPRLMTAVAAFITVWFITGAGEKLEIPAWCTGFLLTLSPYFWMMQGSVLSHTSGLAATAIMLWAWLGWIKDRRTLFAALAGLAWAFLFLNRSYTALWIALPFALDALFRLLRNRNLKQLLGTASFAACAALGVALFLLYNFLATGDPLLPPFLHYNPSEGPGFGIVNGKAHTPAIGWAFLKYNLDKLNQNLWGFSGSLFALLALTIIGWRKAFSPVLVSATVLVWLGYTAFWFRGINELPPIYYYETLAFMMLLAGLGLTRLFRAPWPLANAGKPLFALLLLVLVATNAVTTFKLNSQPIIKHNSYTRYFQQRIHAVPKNSIVVLREVYKDILAQTSWNPRGLESEPLVVRDVNGVTLVLPYLFPGRPVFILAGALPENAVPAPVNNAFQRTIGAQQMRATTGDGNKNETRLAQAGRDRSGKLGYGIRQYLVPGRYEITFFLQAKGKTGEITGSVDVIDMRSGKPLALRSLKPGDERVVLSIEMDRVGLVEPRIKFSGQGELLFRRLEISGKPDLALSKKYALTPD